MESLSCHGILEELSARIGDQQCESPPPFVLTLGLPGAAADQAVASPTRSVFSVPEFSHTRVSFVRSVADI